ncbi:MAG TPA: peptide deformylase [Actinomycetota bacterium]|nr:peptide deformylase [Actinomycetota bacterium]
MTVHEIRRLGDPVLRLRCDEVESFDASLRTLAEEMFETMYAAPGIGLAANQVGRSIRLFVYDGGNGAGSGAVVNPKIVERDGGQEEDEGCLSIPGVYRPTPRALAVRVEGVDLEGNLIALEGEGLLARIFQHETDHLDGTLYVDRLSKADRGSALAEFEELMAQPGQRAGG